MMPAVMHGLGGASCWVVMGWAMVMSLAGGFRVQGWAASVMDMDPASAVAGVRGGC